MPISNDHKALFVNQFSRLPKNQKKVAEYLMEHPQEMAFSSITDIAKRLEVAQATIVRLAKSLGFKGYLEMKTEMLKHVRKNLTPVTRFHLEMDQHTEKDDMLHAIAREEVKNINSTMRVIDKSSFDKAVEFIVSSHHIYTLGLGISAFISQITAYLLNRITLKASSFSHGSVSFIEQVISLKKNDLLITFCLPPYSSGTIEAAKYAREKGIKIITFTDKIISPIVQYSDITFQTKTENKIFANSLSAISVIIYALAAETALKDRGTSNRALSRLEQVRSDYHAIVDDDFLQSNNKFY